MDASGPSYFYLYIYREICSLFMPYMNVSGVNLLPLLLKLFYFDTMGA